MSFEEIYDRMEPEHQEMLAKKHGLRPDQVRKLFEEPKWTVPRGKADRKLLDNIQLTDIVDLPFVKATKTVKFEPKFDTKDMIKLEAKKDMPKLTREERKQRQQQREEELNALLALKQTNNIDPETFVKIAGDGGEI